MADVTYQRGTNLAGYTTPNGYVLQGARQGASPLPYIGMGGTGTSFQRTSYVPTLDTSSRPVTEADIEAARQAQAAAVSTVGNYTPANVQVTKVRQGWLGNLNPELYGGVAEVSANGAPIRVPNALVQQMLFQDAWNQGRSNAMGNFFSGRGNPDPQTYRYSDVGATQGRFNRILEDNPQWTKDEALNPYTAARQKQQAAMSRYNEAVAYMGQPRKETRDQTGRLTSENTMGAYQQQADDALKEAQGYNNKINARRASYYGQQQADAQGEAMRKAFAGGVQQTYSNLPIVERFIR